MAVQELEVFPQVTLDAGGYMGTRKWSLDQGDDVDAFLLMVAESHWPKNPDVVPESIEFGAFWDGAIVSMAGPHTINTLGPTPKYNKYGCVAHYRLHNMTNCWPVRYKKPWHPPGTSLSLKIRGSGQFILVSPASFHPGTKGLCQPGFPTIAQNPAVQSSIIVPVTEYHLSCDRMTLKQVNHALLTDFGGHDWDDRSGTVNADGFKIDGDVITKHFFLGAPPETLLFDGYEIDETYVPHPTDPHRYRMTAILKQRCLVDKHGDALKDCKDPDLFVGWNHDFVVLDKHGGKWLYINLLHHQNCQDSSSTNPDDDCKPRYHLQKFCNMFGTPDGHPSSDCQDTSACGSSGSEGSSFSTICADSPAINWIDGWDEDGNDDSGSFGTP